MAPAPAAPADPAASLRRWPLVATSTLLALCGAALAGIAFLTANPVTLNADQIARADFVVTAVPGADGGVLVEHEWKRGAELGTIRLSDLDMAGMRPGERYLIPLTASGRGASADFRVTSSRGPEDEPLVYPAIPAATQQLERLLARGVDDASRR